MINIVSYNINGIRAGIQKGFIEWLAKENFDIVCLQEIKATQKDFNVSAIEKLGYHTSWFSAQKKGYSGVAILSKIKPQNIIFGNGFEQSDFEGRVIQAEYKDFLLINTYFPSGSSGDERQTYKYQFLKEYLEFIHQKKQIHKNIVILGDYNICHKAIDIHDPVSNKNSSGFLPDERAWMDAFFDMDFIDTFRQINPHPHQYSWWSFRANARNSNKGWRIDYINATKNLQAKVSDAKIFNEIKFSDHAPVLLKIDL